jgi:hypothetical protein
MLNELATATQKGDSGYHVKCLGIEDMWGNIWQWEDGIIKSASAEHSTSGEHCTILRAATHSAMNSDGTNYKQVANILFGYSYESGGHYHENGYITRMNGTTGAIFIPCRGGGTATTYYTDMHDVDEDLRTRIIYGGYWINSISAGVTYRHIADSPSLTSNHVASRLIYLS